MLLTGEIIVDNFAGGGGASEGIEQATGRPVDIAINHDPEAIAMHERNHPWTKHYCQDVWTVDPVTVCAGRPVGLAWFSPDCKHFSKAKGAKPVEKKIRDLAWVVVKWANLVRPRIIMLENVEEFRDWGPLVTTSDGVRYPCAIRKGFTFRRWVRELEKLDYVVEYRERRAMNAGAPTSRKRLFVIARRDGQPIVWPAAMYGPGTPRPHRTAADCIDWSIPCPSIFGRAKPLAENTQRRIANGLRKYVVESANPFIVPVTHTGDGRVHGIDEPFRTITSAPRGELAIVAPYLVPRYGERAGQTPRSASVEAPFSTIVPTANGASLVAAFLAQHNGGARNAYGLPGRDVRKPFSTITATASQQQLVTSHLVKLRGTCKDGQRVDKPMPTITGGGTHIGEVRAFLIKYYGSGGQQQSLRDPMHTVTAKARLGLVTVAGVDYQIVDIGMRMLTARELFRAQGFPDSYEIDFVFKGKWLSKTAQVRMCGNSVSPYESRALAAANLNIRLPEQEAA